MATLAGVALGDSDQAFKGGACIQIHGGHLLDLDQNEALTVASAKYTGLDHAQLGEL